MGVDVGGRGGGYIDEGMRVGDAKTSSFCCAPCDQIRSLFYICNFLL